MLNKKKTHECYPVYISSGKAIGKKKSSKPEGKKSERGCGQGGQSMPPINCKNIGKMNASFHGIRHD